VSASAYIYTDIGDDAHHTWGDLNITYNLSPMLEAAGFRGWSFWKLHPDARAFGVELRKVIATLRLDPPKFIALNPPNGWGDYSGLVAALDNLVSTVPWHREDLAVRFYL